MHRPPKPALVMLLWQFVSYAVVSVPLLFLATWVERADRDQFPVAVAVTCVWSAGALLLVSNTVNRMFLSDDTEGEAAEPKTRRRSFLLPGRYRRFVAWTLFSEWGSLAFFVVVELDYPTAVVAMTVLWALAIGTGWWFWASRGLRFASGRRRMQAEPERVDVMRIPGVGETPGAPCAADGSFSQYVHNLLRAEVLPPLTDGEQRWEVIVDGESVAIVTQSSTELERWPDSEWLTDPDAPFEGVRIAFIPRGSNVR